MKYLTAEYYNSLLEMFNGLPDIYNGLQTLFKITPDGKFYAIEDSKLGDLKDLFDDDPEYEAFYNDDLLNHWDAGPQILSTQWWGQG